MADIEKRLKYYNGQFLQERDFTAEQEYHLDRLRRHNRQNHHPGIADGLEVTAAVGATSASISPGTAIDAEGRQIVLPQPSNVAFASNLHGQWVLVVISYDQEESDDATVGDAGKTRWLERPDVDVILEAGAPRADIRIRLARLRIAANGTIAEVDAAVRTPAGARLRPEETVERLRLSRPGVSANLWPVLSSGAASRADLAGDLSVTGNILVTGNVDGRDVSADGAKLDNLALSQIEGVSNPGGNIDLVGQNGIAIVGNDGGNQITFTASAPASIDSVSNPGGNIDLVAGGAITISPDNGTAKRITISETHSAVTGNPHGTLAAQLADYDFKSVFTDELWFYEFYGNGATRTIEPGFQARLIVVTGYAQGLFFGQWHGSPLHGIARIVGNSIVQNGCGPSVKREGGAPYIFQTGVEATGIVAACSFTNNVSLPPFAYWANVKVSSVTATSVTFMLISAGTSSANWFDMRLRFTCFG